MPYHFLLTIDVEDWFQVENFKQCIPFSSWSSCESRVEKNTHRLLDLLDAIRLRQKTEDRSQKSEKDLKKNNNINLSHEIHTSDSKAHFIGTVNGEQKKLHATFFILGWLAQRLPGLVREIHSRGHEVASHGSNHRLCSECSSEELRKDLNDSKKQLEDITGARVYGYRAPSFSIDDDSLKIIEDCGYLYDSSYNSFSVHSRYGKISLNGNGRIGISYLISEGFYELPISNLPLFPFPTLDTLAGGPEHSRRGILAHFPAASGINRHLYLPWGGGGYFRMMPFILFKRGVQSILKKEKNYMFYIHPWEIDPDQPRVNEASGISKFRHYTNLDKTQSRLSKLMESFSHCRFPTCHQYLQHLKNELPRRRAARYL